MEKLEKDILELLDQDVKKVKPQLTETVKDILKENFSKHPIIIAHLNEIPLGEVIINSSDFELNFDYSATGLEELIEKNVLAKERVDAFKQAYLNPLEKYCLLLVHPAIQKFVFLPTK